MIRIEGQIPDFGDDGACRRSLEQIASGGENDPLLRFSERTELLLPGDCHAFFLDFTSRDLIWRALHSGRHSEAVCRAVMGSMEAPTVYDASAGLGRDSFVLQCAGAKVVMFERNPVVWALLYDALKRARDSYDFINSIPNGLPRLASIGSLTSHTGSEKADSVYYDPMFPKRRKSALVRKEMRVLQILAGPDEDSEQVLPQLLGRATRRVIVKRPAGADRLCKDRLSPSGSVDGGTCRFDIYMVS